MLATSGIFGCLVTDTAVLPPPDFTSATVRLRSPAARQPAGQPAGDVQGPLRLAALPDKFRPQATSRGWKYIILHHSATAGGSVESIDAAHRRQKDSLGNPWLGIGYHFVIGNGQGMADGLVEPTFRWRDQIHGAHAGSRVHNDEGIGICLMGNFDERPPTSRQMAAARELVDALAGRYRIPAANILPHSDVAATRCPGRHFPWSEIKVLP